MKQLISPKMSRRGFLKVAAATGATLALPTFLSGCSGGGASAPLKVGILLPFAGNFAVYGNDIDAGIRLHLEDELGSEVAGRKIEFVQEDSEGNPEVGLQKARKLVEQDEVDLVMGIVSSGVLMAVRDYFDETKKLLICCNAGANAISRGAKTPYIWRSSFTNWMTGGPMATWTAENVGKKAAVVIADYAAGHDERSSFVYHFEQAGGTISDVIAVPFPQMGDPAPIITSIANLDADFFYLFLPGGAGLSFFQSAVEFDLMSKIPMYANNAQVSEDVLPILGDPAEGIISSWLWAYLLDNPENKKYISSYEEKNSRTPNTFSVQGYDGAKVLSTMLERVQGDTSDVNKMIEALAGISFASPRGKFTLDEKTQNPRHDWYLRQVVRHTDGKLHNAVLENMGEIVDPGDDSKG